MIVVASPSYLKGRALPKTPQDLRDHDCIRMRLASGVLYRWEFERRGKQMVVDVQGRITLDESDLIHEAALAGLGFAYASTWWVAKDVAAGRLVQVLDEWTPAFPGLCLYYPGQRHVPAGLRALIDLIRGQRQARAR
jgi:DNA-binding transcriptional LysR family regulator